HAQHFTLSYDPDCEIIQVSSFEVASFVFSCTSMSRDYTHGHTRTHKGPKDTHHTSGDHTHCHTKDTHRKSGDYTHRHTKDTHHTSGDYTHRHMGTNRVVNIQT